MKQFIRELAGMGLCFKKKCFILSLSSLPMTSQYLHKENRSGLPLTSFNKIQTATNWNFRPPANIYSKRALSKLV
jgi:hypothetical protein